MPATRAYGRAGRDVVNNNRPAGGAIFMRMLRACAVTDCSVRARRDVKEMVRVVCCSKSC